MSEKTKAKYCINGIWLDYIEVHRRISRKYGKANKCSNPVCSYKNPKRFHWALIKGRSYSLDIKDYMELCPSCHKKYDFTEDMIPNRAKPHLGKFGGLNPGSKKVIDTKTYFIHGSVREAAKSVGLKETTLIMMLKGNNKNKTNLKYYEVS